MSTPPMPMSVTTPSPLTGPWFQIRDQRLTFALSSTSDLEELTRELVDMRLATYRRRSLVDVDQATSFVCKVSHNAKGDPILFLPQRARADLPTGDTDVRLEDGRVWQFKFVKIACNVARPIGAKANGLPDLLRTWFGPGAGKSGTSFQVRFRRSPEGWWAEPLGVVIELPPLGQVVSFPSLRAAAGSQGDAQTLVEASSVRLPIGKEGQFAVRASGQSMDGGTNPIRDGDWVVMDWARGLGLDAVSGRVALVAKGDADVGHTHHLKRVVKLDEGFVLRSDNPSEANLKAGKDTVPIARLAGIVRPEQLAPRPGTVMPDVGETFGLSDPPAPGVSRIDGHLFLLVCEPGRLTEPDRVRWVVENRAPSETAFVLTQQGEDWRYAGVGRWNGQAWEIPAVDFPTWRTWGEGRGASRRLAPLWSTAAGRLADLLETQLALGDPMQKDGRVCRFQGRSAKGGVRVDHENMQARTVSLLDLAWVIAARNDQDANGGVLDEARVNALRYLDGTPRDSTRWIDTGWALVLLAHAERLGFVATGTPVEGQHPGAAGRG